MLDHFNDIARASSTAMPFVTLGVGLLGSLHCAGMCGPLLLVTSRGVKGHAFYQGGRLLGYLGLGIASGLFGQWFLWQQELPLLTLIPSILMALALILWGLQLARGGKKAPAILGRLYRLMPVKNPFTIGLFSIFLPCGFLYGVALTVATFQNPLLGALAMSAFWLGTLPALSGAPWLMRFLAESKLKIKDRSLGLGLLSIGLISLSYRFYQFYTTGSCH